MKYKKCILSILKIENNYWKMADLLSFSAPFCHSYAGLPKMLLSLQRGQESRVSFFSSVIPAKAGIQG